MLILIASAWKTCQLAVVSKISNTNTITNPCSVSCSELNKFICEGTVGIGVLLKNNENLLVGYFTGWDILQEINYA